MTEKETNIIIGQIVKAIRDAGLNPYDQIYGYVELCISPEEIMLGRKFKHCPKRKSKAI